MELVAHKFLDDVEIEEKIRKQTVTMCKIFHKNIIALSEKYKPILFNFYSSRIFKVEIIFRYYEELQRRNYVTPTSYLELIKTFKDLLDTKRFEILTLRERYVIGIEKLELSENQISIMQKELTDLQPKMIKTSEETEELINVI